MFRKNCSACHRLEQFGTALGADLGAIFDRGKEPIMVNILDPNREVKPHFIVYTAATDDGQVITGLISGETPTSITIVQANGQPRTLLAARSTSSAAPAARSCPRAWKSKSAFPPWPTCSSI